MGGSAEVNGWYTRKEHADGPPSAVEGLEDEWDNGCWDQYNEGRHWYEKDDGCFLYQDAFSADDWVLIDQRDCFRVDPWKSYRCSPPADHWQGNDTPLPTQGWEIDVGDVPAPTLQLV